MGKHRKVSHRKERGIMITKLQAQDGSYCQLCGDPLDRSIKDPEDPLYITFDHLDPASDGGWDDIRNKQLAHYACNQARGAMPLNVFLEMNVQTATS